MSVEIGSLVVRGTFGASGGAGDKPANEAATEKKLVALRRQILEEVEEMLAEADRRRRER